MVATPAKMLAKKDNGAGASLLDSASSNHLLLQVLLVLADAAVPASDRLVLAHHDVLGDLVEQSVLIVSNLAPAHLVHKTITYLKSWETTTTPPEKALIASANESIVGISRPLVGSSSKSMFGDSIASSANTILLF